MQHEIKSIERTALSIKIDVSLLFGPTIIRILKRIIAIKDKIM